MVHRVVWTRKAVEDLRGIKDYISRDSLRYAQAQVERIQAAVARTGRFPEIGRVLPEFPHEPWRQILAGSYRAIYRVDRDRARILVLAVVHVRQILREDMIPPD
jgi:toxin ParE1/3/4